MGTLVGHLVPGLAFSILGLWHTFNTINDYKLQGSSFKSRTWYPLKTQLSILKTLELLLIFSFSIFAIFMQVMDYPFFHLSYKPANFEHATMFFHLAIYACVSLAAELTRSPGTFTAVLGLLSCSVFAQELFLMHFHSADHDGLEGHYHWLLQLIVIVSLLSTIATTGFPTSYPAALVRSVSVLFQGCWFIDMGFVLWVPSLVPKGCFVAAAAVVGDDDMHGAVTCGTEAAGARARGLANLQFSWILAGISIFTACLSLKPDGNCMGYRRLHGAIAADGREDFKRVIS